MRNVLIATLLLAAANTSLLDQPAAAQDLDTADEIVSTATIHLRTKLSRSGALPAEPRVALDPAVLTAREIPGEANLARADAVARRTGARAIALGEVRRCMQTPQTICRLLVDMALQFGEPQIDGARAAVIVAVHYAQPATERERAAPPQVIIRGIAGHRVQLVLERVGST